MADLSPFRMVVDLNAPPATIELVTPPLDLTDTFYDGWESGWNQDCNTSDWDGSDYILWSIASLTLFWDGSARWSSGGNADAVLPDATTTLTWGAGEYAYRYSIGGLSEVYAFAGRWVPMETAPVEGHAGFFAGSQVTLRFWGHAATGPRQCIAGRMRPVIVESGRLNLDPPPEERDDLAILPGELALTFTDQVVGGVTYEPVGIRPEYTDFVFDAHEWLQRRQPRLRVLYRAKP